ncbi:MAG: BrnT family toxin [Thermoanaerobaculia bacterium]
MTELTEFEWDEDKAAASLAKHGLSFEEALTVFDDPLAAIFDDEHHSTGELREIIIGHSSQDRLVLVSFTERPKAVRIISARPATRREREKYEENNR